MLTLKKRNGSQINNLTLYFKELKKEQTKSKSSGREKLLKIRTGINKDQKNNRKNQGS